MNTEAHWPDANMQSRGCIRCKFLLNYIVRIVVSLYNLEKKTLTFNYSKTLKACKLIYNTITNHCLKTSIVITQKKQKTINWSALTREKQKHVTSLSAGKTKNKKQNEKSVTVFRAGKIRVTDDWFWSHTWLVEIITGSFWLVNHPACRFLTNHWLHIWPEQENYSYEGFYLSTPVVVHVRIPFPC